MDDEPEWVKRSNELTEHLKKKRWTKFSWEEKQGKKKWSNITLVTTWAMLIGFVRNNLIGLWKRFLSLVKLK